MGTDLGTGWLGLKTGFPGFGGTTTSLGRPCEELEEEAFGVAFVASAELDAEDFPGKHFFRTSERFLRVSPSSSGGSGTQRMPFPTQFCCAFSTLPFFRRAALSLQPFSTSQQL